MTSFNQSEFTSNTKANGYKFASTFDQDLKTPKQVAPMDGLTKGKEAIRCERIGLLEDKFVQSICKEKQISSPPNQNKL